MCYDDLPGNYVIQSFRRDFENKINDMLAVAINPSGDLLNGYNFSVSPLNVQREGTIEEGGLQGVTTAWDTKWRSATHREKGYWSAELAIPFNCIRFDGTAQSWRINIARNDLKRNEISTWIPVSRYINISSLSNTGFLEFDKNKPKAKRNLVLLPFLFYSGGVDHVKKTAWKNTLNGGIGAKMGVGGGMNLDLTVNPDFSQVDVDRQVTNLSRFNLFYPEVRNFFVENGDLFGRFGFSRIRPFFSRRIGLDDNGNPIPILAGARLSGKPNENWRIGLLDAQTAAVSERNILSQNYLVAAAQRRTIGRSNVAFILVNRQAYDQGISLDNYNSLIGVDYNLNSTDNKWAGKLFYHYTLQPNQPKDAGATALWLNHTGKNLTWSYNHEYVGQNYKADVGYLYRKNFIRFEPGVYYLFYPKSKFLFAHGPGLYTDLYVDRTGKTTDQILRFQYKVLFMNTALLQMQMNNNTIRLNQNFDAAGHFSETNRYLKGQQFNFNNLNLQFTSNGRQLLRYAFVLDYGGYFSGTKLTASTEMSYRLPPYVSVGINYERNEIRLPQPYLNGYYDLLGTKIDLTLTRNLYITTYLQYNTQLKNASINSRLQWRYAPVSDFFVVLSDNYTSDSFKNKNRYLVFKWTYWLGI
jgi:hypothetical protein